MFRQTDDHILNGMTLQISAKCNDCCEAVLFDGGKEIARKSGYVTRLLPGGGGDYIEMEIDLQTGQVLNLVPPSGLQVASFVSENH